MESEFKDLKQKLRTRNEASTPSSNLPSPTMHNPPEPVAPLSSLEDRRNTGPRSDEPAVIDLTDSSAAFDDGVRLLEQGRSLVALDVLRSLEAKRPDDARVWYLAALATGDVTEDWSGGGSSPGQEGARTRTSRLSFARPGRPDDRAPPREAGSGRRLAQRLSAARGPQGLIPRRWCRQTGILPQNLIVKTPRFEVRKSSRDRPLREV